jgi:hypothetical protein
MGTVIQGDGEGSKAEGTTHQVLEYRATFVHFICNLRAHTQHLIPCVSRPAGDAWLEVETRA